MLHASCDGGASLSRPVDHDLIRWLAANRARLCDLDRRRHTRDDVYAIAAYAWVASGSGGSRGAARPGWPITDRLTGARRAATIGKCLASSCPAPGV